MVSMCVQKKELSKEESLRKVMVTSTNKAVSSDGVTYGVLEKEFLTSFENKGEQGRDFGDLNLYFLWNIYKNK